MLGPCAAYRVEKRRNATQLRMSAAIKSLKSEMKRADADFKRDVKATNESHKQKIVSMHACPTMP